MVNCYCIPVIRQFHSVAISVRSKHLILFLCICCIMTVCVPVMPLWHAEKNKIRGTTQNKLLPSTEMFISNEKIYTAKTKALLDIILANSIYFLRSYRISLRSIWMYPVSWVFQWDIIKVLLLNTVCIPCLPCCSHMAAHLSRLLWLSQLYWYISQSSSCHLLIHLPAQNFVTSGFQLRFLKQKEYSHKIDVNFF